MRIATPRVHADDAPRSNTPAIKLVAERLTRLGYVPRSRRGSAEGWKTAVIVADACRWWRGPATWQRRARHN
jgi:hypothetical protein